MKKSLILTSLTTTMVLIFSGCASKPIAPKNSGFFQSYDQLKTVSPIILDAKELAKYKKVFVENVSIIPAISQNEQSAEQKNLYVEASKYATARLREALKFTNSDSKTKDALVLQSALSASEVHFEDDNWNQLSPLSLGINVVSLNAYLDESARLVGEYRLLSGDKTIVKSLNLIKDTPISLNGDFLTLDDLKPSIDRWVDNVASEINKGIE